LFFFVYSQVLSGNIGIDTLKSFTNIGKAVNLAFSLEQMNKNYSTSILIDQNVAEKVKYRFVTRIIDNITTKFHKRPILIHEVLDKIEIKADEWYDFLKLCSHDKVV
jgi:class 3 adenylate cyclase